ncbi:recombinase zinc beta ribbon domain-containing protein [uncultured Sphingomonas sp.]|uniref:recombinase zinc beta ribbon domain-containing protein n=1 Tax=uncultured Sphingomonas sp. TaxID=158754 RepID=UPI0035CA8259
MACHRSSRRPDRQRRRHSRQGRARGKPPRITNSPGLLGGIATCGHPECGSGMVMRNRQRRCLSLLCPQPEATAGAASCPSKVIPEDALDAIVLDGLLRLVLDRRSSSCSYQRQGDHRGRLYRHARSCSHQG